MEIAGVKHSAYWDPRQDRLGFALWLGLIWLGMIAGFGLDFRRYLAQIPAPPLLVHIHAVVFTGWMVFMTGQILFVLRGRFALHRLMGMAGLFLAFLMALLGPATALTVRARQAALPTAHPQFLAVNFGDILAFLLLLAAGIALRRNAAAHKRLMILATVALADPGFARLSHVLLPPAAGHFGWFLQIYYGNIILIAAMAGWDLWKWGRLQPAFSMGALLLLASEAGAAILNFDPAWKSIATVLVAAWPYAG